VRADDSVSEATGRGGVFAANRAVGRIALAVAAQNGATRRRQVYEDGPLRVRFPNGTGRALEAAIVNTAGGIAGGDRHDIGIEVGDGAALDVTTVAAEKVYRALGPAGGEIAVRLAAGAGARLCWLPQETILFDRARLARRIEIDLAADASLLMAEAVVFGRTAMGEAVEEGAFADRWRVRCDGRLIFAEGVRLDGAIAQQLGEAGGLRRRCHRHRSAGCAGRRRHGGARGRKLRGEAVPA
jgi:urease accessory protein